MQFLIYSVVLVLVCLLGSNLIVTVNAFRCLVQNIKCTSSVAALVNNQLEKSISMSVLHNKAWYVMYVLYICYIHGFCMICICIDYYEY